MTMAPVRGWDIQYYGASKQSVLEVDLLETEKIGKCKHLSDFEGSFTLKITTKSKAKVTILPWKYSVFYTTINLQQNPYFWGLVY